MKEEEMLDTSDILAQLSGLNSYNYKYKCTIESWIWSSSLNHTN